MSTEVTTSTLFDRARQVSPGGVHSPVRAFKSVGGEPVFFARGDGAELIDVDGRRYLDFCQSFGPLILGHADPDAARAAHAAIDDAWSFGACEPYSLALAEWITARVPWVDRIRFVSSGTEAVMSAVRVARAATKRPAILKFEGCYHGHADAMLVQAAASKGVPAPGVAVAVAGLLILFGGISIVLGWQPELGITAIVVFLVAVSFPMHNFWAETGAARMNDFINFTKNAALVGASLMFAAVPRPWVLSLDAPRHVRA